MSTFAEQSSAILLRELATLRREIDAYADDDGVWALAPGLPNSAGTLVLHLCGNLRHFVGSRLGSTGYVRDRPREFGARDLPRELLLEEIAAAEAAVRDVLPGLSEAALAAAYPDVLAGHAYATGDFVLHLCTHFAYHLGQIDYHRRIVTGQNVSVGAVPPTALHSATPAA
jgi:hypothetical protein